MDGAGALLLEKGSNASAMISLFSTFGRCLEESRLRIMEIKESHAFLEFVAPGVLHDLGLDPSSSMGRVKEALVEVAQRKASTGATGSDHKSGRWADFVDSFGKLR